MNLNKLLLFKMAPTAMEKMLGGKDEKAIARVTEAFLKMKKFDIAALQRAYDGQ